MLGSAVGGSEWWCAGGAKVVLNWGAGWWRTGVCGVVSPDGRVVEEWSCWPNFVEWESAAGELGRWPWTQLALGKYCH